MNNSELVTKLNELVEPIVSKCGYQLYHIEFVKEQGENFLRVYIDHEAGIGLNDCEKVSRQISDMLDLEDPISDSYYLEVSSPGIERELYNEEHLNKYIGNSITIRLSKLFNGSKKIIGVLKDFNDSEITITKEGEEISIPREKIKAINLNGEI
ncbi:ribosome maturation factor RimP [Clostridium sp. KNHs214]|uniref:ribosome maturation factor RimP n=1 Tax=Clostridium sp. KNHs214 TaxID=1540257 RepID=UPI0005547A26|nr:ribosome maturation factor RimP [Clostridium sp. KNHs214]